MADQIRTVLGARWLIVPILILAVALRLLMADLPPWYDELASIFFAGQPIDHLWGYWMVRETNPPLYYTLLKPVAAAFPYDILLMRLPSVAAGVASVWLCWLILRRIESLAAANIGAVLLTFAALHLNYSGELRGYIFGFLSIALSFYGLLQWRGTGEARQHRRIHLLIYGAGALAAVYFHTTMIVWPMAAAGAILLIDGRGLLRDRPALFDFVAVHLALVAGAAWWLHVSYLQMIGPAQGNLAWLKPKAPLEMLGQIWNSTLLATRPGSDRLPFILALLAQAMIASCAATGLFARIRNANVQLVFATIILSLALFLVMDQVQPMPIKRVMFWLNLLTMILAAIGLSIIVQYRAGWLVLGAVIGLLAINGLQHYRELRAMRMTQDNWLGAVDRLASRADTPVVVLNAATAVPAVIACNIRMRGRSCPYEIIMIDEPSMRTDYWSQGQYPASSNEEMLEKLRCAPRFYIFRRNVGPEGRFKSLGIDLPPPDDHSLQGPFRLSSPRTRCDASHPIL